MVVAIKIDIDETRQEKLEKLLTESKQTDNRVVMRVSTDFIVNKNQIPEKELIKTTDGDYINILLPVHESEKVRAAFKGPLCYLGERPCYSLNTEFAKELLGEKAYI